MTPPSDVRRSSNLADNATSFLIRSIRVLAFRGIGAAAAFAVAVAIGRVEGAGGAGSYYLGIAIVSVGALIARLGMDMPMMRQVSASLAAGDSGEARALVRTTTLVATPIALALAIAIYGAAGLLGTLFHDPDLPGVLRILSVAVVPATLGLILGRAVMAAGYASVSEVLQRAGLHLSLLAILALVGSTLWGSPAAIAFTGANWVVLAVGMTAWLLIVRPGRSVRIPAYRVVRPGLHLLVAGSFTLVLAWSDTILLGILRTSAEVGVYGSAVRVASFVTFVFASLSAVAGPMLAASHASGDKGTLSTVARRVVRWASVGAAVPAITIVVFAPQILSLFGDRFDEGAGALRILALGQYSVAVLGVSSLLLMMSNREQRVKRSAVIAAGFNVLLNVALIPLWGTVGAAMATASSLALAAVLNTWFVHRDLGIRLLPRSTGR